MLFNIQPNFVRAPPSVVYSIATIKTSQITLHGNQHINEVNQAMQARLFSHCILDPIANASLCRCRILLPVVLSLSGASSATPGLASIVSVNARSSFIALYYISQKIIDHYLLQLLPISTQGYGSSAISCGTSRGRRFKQK
jgi:hypothetical protein